MISSHIDQKRNKIKNKLVLDKIKFIQPLAINEGEIKDFQVKVHLKGGTELLFYHQHVIIDFIITVKKQLLHPIILGLCSVNHINMINPILANVRIIH